MSARLHCMKAVVAKENLFVCHCAVVAPRTGSGFVNSPAMTGRRAEMRSEGSEIAMCPARSPHGLWEPPLESHLECCLRQEGKRHSPVGETFEHFGAVYCSLISDSIFLMLGTTFWVTCDYDLHARC